MVWWFAMPIHDLINIEGFFLRISQSNLLAISFIILEHIHKSGKIPSQENPSSYRWFKELV